VKRLFDLTLSTIALILLAPLFGVAALFVKLTSRGPVLYRAERVGQHGRPFILYKFRSMYEQPKNGRLPVTRRGDPRVTPIGRFLRSSKIDEVPQLINVLIADMSIVGPRPEDPHYVAMYSDAERELLSVRPGITSPASIAYRNEATLLDRDDWEQFYIDVVMPEKARIDIDYMRRRSLVSDLGVIMRTLLSVGGGQR